MKKLLLLLIPLVLTGCFDYNELNDLAIISGIAIDYEDDEFKVTFEILSTKKEGETSGATSSYNTTGHGKNMVEAFAHNSLANDKVPYYEHISIVIISEEVAKNHFEEVCEFLIRNSKMRNEFYTVVATQTSAQSILSTTSKEKPVASTFIVGLLEHANKSSSTGYYTPFTNVLSKIITDGEDCVASSVTLKDEQISLNGLAVFKDFELVYIFNEEEASIFNLLNNFKPNMVYFEYNCSDNKKCIITTYEAKIDIESTKDNILVKGRIEARIQEDGCNYDLKEEKSYTFLEDKFKEIIKEKMQIVLTTLQDKESNALSIGKKYYNKTRDDSYFKWINQEIIYDFDLKINKKGLIFEVEN